MPLKKIVFKPGVNRENTRYTTEGGWYDCDKVRFRQGTPEKIGGWARISSNTFLGVCRSLWNWVTLGGANLMAVGTNLKFYLELGGAYYDVTPLRYFSIATATLTNPFDTTAASNIVTVNDVGSNVFPGDVVVISGVVSPVDGIPVTELNARHTVVSRVSADEYTIEVATNATAGATGVGGTVNVEYFYYVVTLGSNPFATISGSNVVTVSHNTHQCRTGDFVTFSGASAFNNVTINGEYQVTVVNSNSYTIQAATIANATGSGGGSAVEALYQINTGSATQTPRTGWSTGFWGSSFWGTGVSLDIGIRLWNEANFGEDLVFGPRGGGLYYWQAGGNISDRGIAVSTMAGASDVPVIQNLILISDVSRFVFCMGTNDYGSTVLDPMLIRWSDQESVTNWTPSITNQAGSIRLSHGSEIISTLQVRQEVLVWTDSSLYSLQYVGAPVVWGSTLLADNTSMMGPNAAAVASGVTYWMGKDKFYKYDGRVNTLRCDLRQYIFQDINTDQNYQIFASTNEGFNEVWWFYCSQNSSAIDKYVVYNYAEDIWYYGTMARTAWIDSGLRDYPVAATYNRNLVNHEFGVNDNIAGQNNPIYSYITSSQFDIDDGHNFGFIWRMLPDITFRGSQNGPTPPKVNMTLIPYKNSGSGANIPPSVGGSDNADVNRITVVPIEEFTGQVYIRVRGRQLAFKIESDEVGTAWQLGAPRIDIRPDGRR